MADPGKDPRKDGFLVTAYKKYMTKLCRRRFGNAVSPEKIDQLLDDILDEKLREPKIYAVNNQKRKVAVMGLLTFFQSIVDSALIVGGASVTYLQHAVAKNPFRDFILMLRFKRNDEKKTRKKYDRVKQFADWSRWNRKQNNTKIISNSLYGVLGYAKFIFYNVFLAESITRMGRTIIATAATGFENFLADNVCIACESELYEYISVILDEYDEKWTEYDPIILGVEVSPAQVKERLIKKCQFDVSSKTEHHLDGILNRLSPMALLLLYFRNNFMEFNRVPFIRDQIVKIVKAIPSLQLPELKAIESEETREDIQTLWSYYDLFVFNPKPVYDNVRKMMYGTRKAVLYIDTDSNFISLARWVDQIENEFLHSQYDHDPKEFVFVCANVLTIFLTEVVDRNLKDFAARCGITEEWRQYLSMKNEFFFWRILFGDVKKRYIDLQLIQEGQILNEGLGLPEIKGYDFRKFSTKAPIREYYTEMCLNDILRPETIDLRHLLRKCYDLKREVSESMRRGESKYLKQANVSSPDHYADPFRISGIKGVMLWNALCPEQLIELPAEVDLIPIRNLATNKYRTLFAERYPEIYAKLEREIFNNRNPNIAKMALNVIAKPRNDDIQMPDWLLEFMDTGKIVNATIKLIHPIMESLGIKIARPTKNKEVLTNIVDL